MATPEPPPYPFDDRDPKSPPPLYQWPTSPVGQPAAAPIKKSKAGAWGAGAAVIAVLLVVGILANRDSDPGQLAGGGTTTAATTVQEPTEATTTSPTPTQETVAPTTTMPAAGPAELGSRGLLAKKIGEPGGMLTPDGSAQSMQFTVTKITGNFQCPGAYASPPENGQFLAIDINFETFELPTDLFYTGTFGVSSSDWGIIALDNTKQQNVTSASTFGCIDTASGFEELGPNQKLSTTIVLDTNQAHGYVTFMPPDLASGGWEIQY